MPSAPPVHARPLPLSSDPEFPDVPPPHRPLPPGEVPTPILPDPGEPGPIVPEPLPEREPSPEAA